MRNPDRKKCVGKNANGDSCRAYAPIGETFCRWHADQGVAKAPVESVAKRVLAAGMNFGSPEESLEWLNRVESGEVGEWKVSPRGDPVEIPTSTSTRIMASSQAQKLRDLIDEREKNYIPRDLVADAMVSTATLVAERLAAMPARLADRLTGGATITEIRATLTTAVDDLRAELGDDVERHLERLLGTE